VHGDEYEGMEAIRRVAVLLDPATMSGTFAAVPVANPLAYEARSRVTPALYDGLNLARVFPGDPTGSPTQRLAHALLDLVQRNVGSDDLFLDLHSGSADVAFERLVGVRDLAGAHLERAREAARHTGMVNLWAIPDSPGPFNAETSRRGIPTLSTETTGRAGCEPDDVAAFERLLRSLLVWLEIVPGLLPPANPSAFRSTIEVTSPTTGFLRSDVRLGDQVLAGQRLGDFVDLFGVPVGALVSPISGTLWAVRETPAVRGGELCYMIARSTQEDAPT
jgi:predicted deacylase